MKEDTQEMPTPIKDIMSNVGINLEDMRKTYYDNGGLEKIIESNKKYILDVCRKFNDDIWSVVKSSMLDNDANTILTEYQKRMSNASLLLAWEELERDDLKLVVELWQNSRVKIN